MSINHPKIILEDGYGGKYIKKGRADYFWGESASPHVKKWLPQARIPQLETLIELFNGMEVAIAGGSVLASYDAVEYGDIDVFPLNAHVIIQLDNVLTNFGYKKKDDNDGLLLYEREDSASRPVQVCLLHIDVLGDVQKMLSRFDISICQMAILNKELHTNTITLQDIRARVLRVNKTMNINSLISRLVKYNKRGYSIIDARYNEDTKSNSAK